MIFDSVYDTYRGVVTYVRVIDGNLNPRERIVMMSTWATTSSWRSVSSALSRCRARVSASARSGTSSPASRTCGRAGRRHRHQHGQARERGARWLPRPQADGVLGTVSPTAPTTPTCVRRSTSSSSTTPRSSTSPRPPWPWASASAAASSGCCTSRSSVSGSSASSTSSSSRPSPTSSMRWRWRTAPRSR